MGEMYKNSGVDIEEADKLSSFLVANSSNKNLKTFAGSAFVKDLNCRLINCCDGIGSKIIPLYERKMYKAIAIDLIAANLNDLVTQNAKAVSFSDYIAVHKLNSNAVGEIILNLENELSKYNCVLSGGETSELPHLLRHGTIDICGFAIGISINETPPVIEENDIIIGLKSSGIHANGFTLLRRLYEEKKLSDKEFVSALTPAFVYYNVIRKLWEHKLIKAGAHITGGGILSNLNRVFPNFLRPELDISKIPVQKIYQKLLSIAGDEIYSVFNCGVGFCVTANPKYKNEIFQVCAEFEPFEFGKVVNK